MDHWTQAIFDSTGIPLNEDDLALAFREGEWWLALHGYPILPLGSDPDPHEAVTPVIRSVLAHGMAKRLSEAIPKVEQLMKTMGGCLARDVQIAVVTDEENGLEHLEHTEFERGWPHFLLRLSTGDFDVEVDLNPYSPDNPLDLDEVQRQADVILQLVDVSSVRL